MKLNKDQQQKIALGVMLMFGVIYATNEFLLSPLAAERLGLSEEMTTAEPRIRDMKGQLARVRGLAEKGPAADKTLAQVNAMIPEGSPIAWFPPKIADFFKNNGVDKAVAKLNNESPEKELTGYRRLVWSIDIPNADFVSFASSLSKLENEEPLFEFSGFELQATRERVDTVRASVTVQNIIKL